MGQLLSLGVIAVMSNGLFEDRLHDLAEQPAMGQIWMWKNSETEWPSCQINEASQITASMMQPGPVQMAVTYVQNIKFILSWMQSRNLSITGNILWSRSIINKTIDWYIWALYTEELKWRDLYEFRKFQIQLKVVKLQ